MVRAILEGRKTQTRRIAKPFNMPIFEADAVHKIGNNSFIGWNDGGSSLAIDIEFTKSVYKELDGHACPFGSIGDRLWVRETFNYYSCDCYEMCSHNGLVYKADEKHCDDDKWLPSIHMPRKASRINLQITNIRCERLQNISKYDAIQEGIESFRPVPGDGLPETVYRRYSNIGGRPFNWVSIPEFSYLSLWESIYGVGSCERNPWVWVIEFKRV